MTEKNFIAPKTASTRGSDLPWSVPLAVAQIPQEGSHVVLEADAAQREGLARLGGLRDVIEASAEFDLTPLAGGGIHAVGLVRGLVGQSCVVTLEPVDNPIEEAVDVLFLPEQHVALSTSPRPPEGDEEIPEPPEPLRNGVIDLGKLAMDILFLGIDPYPRKPGAVFIAPAIVEDPDEHPFAALRALKDMPPG